MFTAVKIPFARRRGSSHYNEEVCSSESILCPDGGRTQQKTTLGFVEAEDDWMDKKIAIFEPIFGPFSKAYKYMYFRRF